MLLREGAQAGADGLQRRRLKQALRRQHLGVGHRGPDVVGDQAVIERVVLARGVGEHRGVHGLSLVPEARHAIPAAKARSRRA